MCLAIPGKLLDREERAGQIVGRVEFGGTVREALLDFVPEAQPGDYVLVHVGFAISRLDEAEAQITLKLIAEAGGFDAGEEEVPDEAP